MLTFSPVLLLISAVLGFFIGTLVGVAGGHAFPQVVAHGMAGALICASLFALLCLVGYLTSFRYGWGAVAATVFWLFSWTVFRLADEPPRLAAVLGSGAAALVFASFYFGA